MFFFFCWISFSIFVSVLAHKRSRNFFGWLLLALLFSPLLAVLFLLVLPIGGNCKCQFCAERIRPEAKVCKHCGRDVVALNAVGIVR